METGLFDHPLIQELILGQKSLTNHPLSNEFLRNLYLIIEDNIDDSFLNVSFLAKRLAVSKSTLNRRLSILVGLSANEIIKQHRLKKAAIFLMSGKNVSETAYLTGFETPSYFTQCFKEFYKITPKKYFKRTYSSPRLD